MKRHTPILLLLAALLLAGLFTFPNYGLSWDEPLFYEYAESIPRAYQGWDGIDESVYSSSPGDHKYYGPAYLLIGRPLKNGLQIIFGMENAPAWHLVNFFSFILGVFFIYRLGNRFLPPSLSTVNAAFFALQPLLWGHAFINPKDIPFMTAFLAAVTLGLEWVDSIPEHRAQPAGEGRVWRILRAPAFPKLILATLALGIASAIRVIGPLAGVLVFVYFLFLLPRFPKTARPLSLIHLFAYILFSILLMFSLWPFLWADPIHRLLEVLRHMSNNPTELAVLFMGQVWRANELPARYFPQMLILTITEPFAPLAIIGGIHLAWQIIKKKLHWAAPLVLFLWVAPIAAYNVITVPAMYDGIRHFLFILPPLFILTGCGLLWLYQAIQPIRGLRHPALLLIALLLPGILAIKTLHPYQYTYYNLLAGPTYRVYENDYWLTCYKESLEWVQANQPDRPVYIQREISIARPYAKGLDIHDLRYETPESLPNNALMLFSTRANLDQRSEFRRMPILHAIERNGVEFCLIKQKD